MCISLGAGVQSTTMALMAAHGEIAPMPTAAIFADTQWEPKSVYEHLDWLSSPNVLPFPVIRVTAGNIREDIIAKAAGKGRFASVPFFMSGGGMGRRQCTKEYKIYPIRKGIRDLLGVPFGIPPASAAELWIGISTDEAVRAKPSGRRYIDHRWPLLEKKISRGDCERWLLAHEYPIPPKSACIGCPFHNDAMWGAMQRDDPVSFLDAVMVDSLIRDGGTNMQQQQYMHRSLRPLGEVHFEDSTRQADLFNNECEGMCGV